MRSKPEGLGEVTFVETIEFRPLHRGGKDERLSTKPIDVLHLENEVVSFTLRNAKHRSCETFRRGGLKLTRSGCRLGDEMDLGVGAKGPERSCPRERLVGRYLSALFSGA